MNQEKQGWMASRWAQLSTGLKMLLILSLALLPLGIIAVLASINSARDNWSHDNDQVRAALARSAQQLDAVLSRSAITIRAAGGVLGTAGSASNICQNTLVSLSRLPDGADRYALYGGPNHAGCATPGFAPPRPAAAPAGTGTLAEISPDGRQLRIALFGPGGNQEGVAEFSAATLSRLVGQRQVPGSFDLELVQNERRMPLRDDHRETGLGRDVNLSRTLASAPVALLIRGSAVPLTASELLMILLPVMMWLAAAGIGWWIADRLLLRPLVRMQRVVSAYRPGDRTLDLPTLRSPAREISALGEAFDQVTRTVARHEAELEAAVERQTRLVREVHHRVKNNLQVVASLLNLHSRGSANEEVAAAYASIQRRVDALAVVHRNHYAELEENRGVALKPLISELAANLRATAPPSAAHMQIRLGIEPFYVNQDVAVSVAFLITEIVEFGMLCDARSVAITLEEVGPTTALLAIESDSLAGEIACDEKLFTRFDRIVTGLSRQLRSTMDRDPEQGRYSLTIAVVEKAER